MQITVTDHGGLVSDRAGRQRRTLVPASRDRERPARRHPAGDGPQTPDLARRDALTRSAPEHWAVGRAAR
ncbi:hypothetical protein GCM10008019_32110 [Deinococcus soli (ex Cha et al. 2016)]|nr:hypothetical protein GCM10008019_32110 [Deinococcus soli (ex Cha et al. 2016)]